jgi:hypothetical protein
LKKVGLSNKRRIYTTPCPTNEKQEKETRFLANGLSERQRFEKLADFRGCKNLSDLLKTLVPSDSSRVKEDEPARMPRGKKTSR